MIYKRIELDIRDLKNDINRFFYNFNTNGLVISKTNIYEISKEISIEIKFHTRPLSYSDKIYLEMNVINIKDSSNIFAKNNMFSIEDEEELSLIYDFLITEKINGIKNEYLLLLKLNMFDEDNENVFNSLRNRTINAISSIYTFNSVHKQRQFTDNLFIYENPSYENLLILIYYFISFLYFIEVKNVCFFDTSYYRDIINSKADFLGIPYDEKGADTRATIIDCQLAMRRGSIEERVLRLMDVINLENATTKEFKSLLSIYSSNFEVNKIGSI